MNRHLLSIKNQPARYTKGIKPIITAFSEYFFPFGNMAGDYPLISPLCIYPIALLIAGIKYPSEKNMEENKSEKNMEEFAEIIKTISEKNNGIRLKEFKFLELDYCELFGDLVPHYIEKLHGVRVWVEDGKYSIQENNVFQLDLTEEEVVKKIVASYERFERMAKAEKQSREIQAENEAKQKIEELKEKISSRQDLPKETLEFLTSILN